MKTLLITLLLLVFVVVVAALAAPSFIDWNGQRQRIAEQMSQVLGREVAIGGDLAFALFPTPRLSARDVSIAGTPGSEPLATAGALDLRLSWPALFSGRIEVASAVLIRPHVVLSIDEAGQGSWQGPTPVLPVEIGRFGPVSVEDGTAEFRDMRSGRDALVIGEIFAQLTAGGLEGPFAGAGSFSLWDRSVTFDVSLRRRTGAGAFPATAAIGIDGVAGEARFAGLLLADGDLQGDLSVVGQDLGGLLASLEPEFQPPARLVSRPYQLRAVVAGGKRSLSLSSLSVDLDRQQVTGSARFEFEPRRRIALDLTAQRLDVDALFGTEDRTPADFAAELKDLARTGRIPDSEVELRADLLGIGGSVIRDVRLAATLAGSGVDVARFEATLPGGTRFGAAGAATLRSESIDPSLDLGVEVSTADLRGLAAWLQVPLDGVPAGRLQTLDATARLLVAPGLIQVAGLSGTLDGTQLSGGLSLAMGDRVAIGLELSADRLNLDGYLPRGAAQDAIIRALAALSEGRLEAFPDSADATLRLEVDQFGVADRTLSGLVVDATAIGGALDIRRLAFGLAGGATMELVGRVGKMATLEGLDFAIKADVPDPAATAAVLPVPPAIDPARVGRLAVDAHIAGRPGDLEVQGLVEAFGGSLQASGHVAGSTANPDLEGAIRARHPDLARLMADAAGLRTLPEGLGVTDVYFRANGNPAALSLADIAGIVAGTTLSGQLDLRLDGEKPWIGGRLVADRFEPARWLAGDRDAPSLLGGPWSLAPIDLSPLGRVEASLDLAIGTLTMSSVGVNDVALSLGVDGERIIVSGLSGRVWGGTLGLELMATATAAPEVTISIDLVEAAAEEVMPAVFGGGGVSGQVSIGLDGTTAGRSEVEMVSGFTGSGLVAISDAEVEGVDLAGVAAVLTGPPVSASEAISRLQAALGGGTSRFAAVNATFTAEDGRIESRDLRAVSDLGVLEGEATLDLPRWRLDLDGRYEAFGAEGAPSIGLVISGDPGAPVLTTSLDAVGNWAADRAATLSQPAP